MSEKLNGANLEIELTGKNAATYLAKKGVLIRAALAGEGRLVVSRYTTDREQTLVGTTKVQFELFERTNNREVVLFGGPLGNGERGRKISVANDTGIGKQQFKEGIDIIVRTDAKEDVFKTKVR